MAETRFASGDALAAQLWSAALFKEAIKDIFFAKYVGTSDSSIIQSKMELTKKKGEIITFGLRMRLTGEGVNTDNDYLEGNEEEMTFHDLSVTLQERGNAVRAKSKLDLQRPAFDLRTQFKAGLKDWLTEYIDRTTIEALSASPTSNRNIFGGDATSTSDIDSSDTLSTTVISKAKRTARLATPKIRPIVVEGEEHYLLLCHDYQTKAIKAETAWINAQRDAGVRGRKNALFSGALGMWDGVVIKEYERVQTYRTWGSGADLTGARALLLGAQAGIHAYGQLPKWYEKMFDYGRIPGVATDVVWRAAKTVFNSEDFGTVAVNTYYAGD